MLQESSHSPEQGSNSLDGSKKRKREMKGDVKNENRLKRPKFKHNASGDEDLDLSLGINNAFAYMDNHLLADYITQRTRNFENELSSVELEDKYISATAIIDTTSWDKPRSLENLSGFLEAFSRNPAKLWLASKKKGAPHTILVASAGLRAADLARFLRKFQTKDATVAKLFAKHIKIDDAIKFLQNTRTGIAVGTPKRLIDLMERGALSIDKLERIVIDASHIDQKKRGVLEMRETQIPLASWLSRKEFKERLGREENAPLLFSAQQ